jgi:hypothetical protein
VVGVSWVDVPGPDGFAARVLRIGPGWFFFLQPAGSGYWLCGGADREAAPESIELDEQKRAGTEKLCALLGLTWEEIEADPATSADWQLKCMERMGPNMKRRLQSSSVEEIADWRAQMHTLEPGEALREKITGIDPLAVGSGATDAFELSSVMITRPVIGCLNPFFEPAGCGLPSTVKRTSATRPHPEADPAGDRRRRQRRRPELGEQCGHQNGISSSSPKRMIWWE